jgi:predicted TIM-barrel fold metal-dependent hydrolase
VATLEEIEARLAAVEQQLQIVRQDAAAARVLAGAADRDVSEFRQTLSAHTQTLNALRETQVEQGQKLDAFQRETRDGFAKVNQGMQQITQLLTRLIDRESGE